MIRQICQTFPLYGIYVYTVYITNYTYLSYTNSYSWSVFFISSQNAVLCLLFGICFFIEGIYNINYGHDNDQLYTDICLFIFGFDGDEFCENLERASEAEIATGVS